MTPRNTTAPARNWRDIPQQMSPRTMSSEGRRRVTRRILKTAGFLVVLEDRSHETETRHKLSPRKQKLLWMLTPSEREIALLICEGRSNVQIAKQLKKSVLTIKKQNTSIFQKTGVPGRSRLMALLR